MFTRPGRRAGAARLGRDGAGLQSLVARSARAAARARGVERRPHPSACSVRRGIRRARRSGWQQRLDARGLVPAHAAARALRRHRHRVGPGVLAAGARSRCASPTRAPRSCTGASISTRRRSPRKASARPRRCWRRSRAALMGAGVPALRRAGRHRPAHARAAGGLRQRRAPGDAGPLGAAGGRAPGRRSTPTARAELFPRREARAALLGDDGPRARLRGVPAPRARVPRAARATRSRSASPCAATAPPSCAPPSAPTTPTCSLVDFADEEALHAAARRRRTFTSSACVTTGRAWSCRRSSSRRWRSAARCSTRAPPTPRSRAGSPSTIWACTCAPTTSRDVADRLHALVGDAARAGALARKRARRLPAAAGRSG